MFLLRAWLIVASILLGSCDDDAFFGSSETVAIEPFDSFFVGVNYPWLNYGHDAGVAWGVEGIQANELRVANDLNAISSEELQVIRWFLFADGRAAPEFEGSRVVGLDEFVIDDVRMMLDLAEASGLKVVVTLFDYLWFEKARVVNGVQLGGRSQTIQDPEMRQTLLNDALLPLLQSLGEHPAILLWDVINEPIWAIETGRPLVSEPLSLALMQKFVSEVSALIHENSPYPVSVGSASVGTMLRYWSGDELDVLQFHAYAGVPRVSRGALGELRPILLGESPTRVDKQTMLETLRAAYDLGYAGFLPWSFGAEDVHSDYHSVLPVLSDWRKHIDDSSP